MTMQENANDSPRISFSQDFCHYDSIPIEQRPLQSPLESSNFYWGFPFNFSIPGDVLSGESSWSAEEFFNDGKILPTEMKRIPEPKNRSPDHNQSHKYKTGLPKPEINPIEDFEPVLQNIRNRRQRRRGHVAITYGITRPVQNREIL